MSQMSKPDRRADVWAKLWLIAGAVCTGFVSFLAFTSGKPIAAVACLVISLACAWAALLASPKLRQALAGILP
jgi:hypothetical protein